MFQSHDQKQSTPEMDSFWKGNFMRIRWRNLELPIRVVCNKEETVNSGELAAEFVAEPFEPGFGRTIGNSIRRVLLSAIEGCAVTSVKIEGIQHEFSTLPGVLEDITEIIINIKKLRIKMELDCTNPVKLWIKVKRKGVVTAADIQFSSNASIINKDLVIATLTDDREFLVEMEAQRGRGYLPAEKKEPQEIGVIPIASIFTPVRHVEYLIENTRVGNTTNYDRLILKIRTDGSITPEIALVEAAKILRKHLNPFVQYSDIGLEVPQEPKETPEEDQHKQEEKQKLLEELDQPVTKLDLTVRAVNCLTSINVRTIRDLVKKTENDLLKIRNFGKTSLNDIKENLKKINLHLGMQLDDVQTPE